MLKLRHNQKGTALLTALLVMGVLMAISLALSMLVLREIRTVAAVVDAGKAYYAAESGIEVSLYKLNDSLPGWETDDDRFEPLVINAEKEIVGEYRVDNTCNAYPCFEEGFDTKMVRPADLKEYYDSLDLNESITLPLFVVKDGEGEVPVGDFTVEFYVAFDPAEHFNEQMKANFANGASTINQWDVLRWKVFGIEDNITESISDFTAISSVKFGGYEDEHMTNSTCPSWFGTVSCDEKNEDERYTNEILCGLVPAQGVYTLPQTGMESPIITGICSNTEAREHYDYNGEEEFLASECYPIKNFLGHYPDDGHDLNYLTLTNMMNPSVFDEEFSSQIDDLSKIYFRVELFADPANPGTGNETVREFADITANGYSGDSKRSINVKIQRGSFLPVFDFSLYSTYGSDDGFYLPEE